MPIEPDQAPKPTPAGRQLTFDILKGIGIFEVMLHHSLASSARHYGGGREAAAWWGMMVGNRVLHFAVPVFLLASALLLARSLSKHTRPDWKRFYLRRLERSVWPLLIWTGLWILARLFVLREAKDVAIVTAEWPWGSVTGPALLVDPAVWVANLVWGKGAYHMYFLAVLIQMAIVFPLLYFGIRQISRQRGSAQEGFADGDRAASAVGGFGLVLIGSILLQLAIFWGQGNLWRFGSPWSMIISYLPPVLVGTWLGLNWADWPRVWQTWRWPVALLTAGAFSYYLWVSVQELARQPISSFGHRSSYMLFSAGISLILLAWAGWLAKTRIGRGLAWLGNLSLALFLIHPFFLYLLGMPASVRVIKALPVSPVASFLLMAAATVLVTLASSWLRLDTLLFGRKFFEGRALNGGPTPTRPAS